MENYSIFKVLSILSFHFIKKNKEKGASRVGCFKAQLTEQPTEWQLVRARRGAGRQKKKDQKCAGRTQKLAGGGAEQISDSFAAPPDPAQLPGVAVCLRWASASLVWTKRSLLLSAAGCSILLAP